MNSRYFWITTSIFLLACGVTALPIAPTETPYIAPTDTPTPTYQQNEETVTYIIAARVYTHYAPAGRVTGVVSLGERVKIEICVAGWCKTEHGWIWIGCLSIAKGRGCEAR